VNTERKVGKKLKRIAIFPTRLSPPHLPSRFQIKNMIIDRHGHHTTAPKELQVYRDARSRG
jgi:hypothetical protein